jgi:uncharacterized protein (UPF0218 family)
MRKIIYREVPKPPGPSGEIGVDLWRAICEYNDTDYDAGQEIYLEGKEDLAWLRGFSAATSSAQTKTEIYKLVAAIQLLGQVQIVWITE